MKRNRHASSGVSPLQAGRGGRGRFTARAIGIIGLWMAAATGWSAGLELAYRDLVGRLTDLEILTQPPVEGERCEQWSSYDRASRWDAATGKYAGWDANGDGGGYIRKEGDSFVLAEMAGPGCIWRIWSALPEKGHVRIYLDGAAAPAVDLPFVGYFDRENEPFTRPALVHTVARGWNNYTPIPYQKSCKIVADAGWGKYYQFVYSTFPAGTRVPTFRRAVTAADARALDEANARLEAGDRFAPRIPAGSPIERYRPVVRVGPGKRAVIARLSGAGAIVNFRARLDLPESPADRTVLRELALRMAWDGESSPSVWSPLGDFFGTAAGANRYESLPLGLAESGWWYCHWWMPFADGALLEIENDGSEERAIEFEVDRVRWPREQAEGRARLHAKWHRDAFLPAEPERAIDWTILDTAGRGRFAGVMLHVWNPRGSWWGEGDEKFFVDGEKFPSTIGTGSEDYFGYAWCDPALFQNAFHNQTISMGNKGHVSVNRWHIADAIPFQKSFAGFIEKYYPNRRPTLYAAVAYWYLMPGGRDPYEPLPLSERAGYWTEIAAWKAPGAIEGEQLRILRKTAGNPHEQSLDQFDGQWSNDAHLWWIQAKPGDQLDLAIPVRQTGKYLLSVQMTRAPDYGIVQLRLDGADLGRPIDLYHPSVAPTGLLNLGEHALSAGQHRLTIEIVGANAQAKKSYMAGMDYVKLDRLDP
ncbi:MAG TPA: DUF2961 domain-containing protein [Candidatus Paceibacterota bacterium]|nr:DUF2961 domain-containing protein [Verrucomicrobiota bacterium]HRZ45078.1 DUF2961 domain-containing protein [Candidatus Paceibacterota bacterium]